MQIVNWEQARERLKTPFYVIIFVLLGYHLLFWGRVFPSVEVAGLKLAGKNQEQAEELLDSEIKSPKELVLTFEQNYSIPLGELEFAYDFQKTAQNAISYGRDKDIFPNLLARWNALVYGETVPLSFNLNEKELEEKISFISGQVSQPALEPSVSVQGKGIVVNPGKNGRELDGRLLKQKLYQKLALGNGGEKIEIELPLRELTPKLTDEEAESLKGRAEKLLGKKLLLEFEREVFSYPDEELVGLLDPREGFDRLKATFLAANIADGLNRTPQNATFVFRDGRVQEFQPAKDGITVREEELSREILEKLELLAENEEQTASTNIPVNSVKPEISTEEVNNLGIKELLGRGTSRFRGSIPSRVHNIGLSASKINGALVKPEEIFSFNRTLGDISVYTGYQQAYVISGSRTILGDGGGVCQVSTTFFRAALDAGLPIVERHQHSYRVSYYEQGSKPGIDATIYVPTVDLKVKNDTPGHLLIQSSFDPKISSLVFEIYGTADGRQVSISTPRVWDVKAPPPALYQDDPTLPVGTSKQIDFAAWGAKAAFDYKVVRDGEVLQDRTFYSNFRPWQAVYLRGTGPAQ